MQASPSRWPSEGLITRSRGDQADQSRSHSTRCCIRRSIPAPHPGRCIAKRTAGLAGRGLAAKVVFRPPTEAEDGSRPPARRLSCCRIETSPEDIHGMHAARGILTTRGGMTSHAAVVARGMGRACVAGAGELRIDLKLGIGSAGTRPRAVIAEGDIITIDGSERRGHAGRRGADHPARAFRRLRHPDGMGRPERGRHGRAGQCGHAAATPETAVRVRRRGHRSLPHRAHVLRGRAHRRGARDDPGGQHPRPTGAARWRRSCRCSAQDFVEIFKHHGRACR